MKLFIFLLCVLSSAMLQAESFSLHSIPNPKQAHAHHFVSNPDGILDVQTVSQLNVMLDSLAQATSTEVAVVAVNSIGNEPIESFATALFQQWGIGQANEDNGLLVLFVLDQRAIRFETGYGLEGVLPDALGNQIQQQFFIPHFRNNDYDQGFLLGMQKVVSVLKNETFAVAAPPQLRWSEVLPYVGAAYLLILLLTILWIHSSAKKVAQNTVLTNNQSRYMAMKSEKAGMLMVFNILLPAAAFLGIFLLSLPIYLLFLIGIPIATLPASLYAKTRMRQFRRAPIPCNSCDGTMHLLPERKEDAYLKISQQFEEELNAVDYDVFVCKECSNEAIVAFDQPSMYTECQRCKTKAFILHDKRVIVEPSFVNPGTERSTYKCKFCGYEEHKNTKLPRISRNTGAFVAGSAAGSIFSGRGGFGGGGFGGGGFGGGLSGGGGVTGRW